MSWRMGISARRNHVGQECPTNMRQRHDTSGEADIAGVDPGTKKEHDATGRLHRTAHAVPLPQYSQAP